MIFISFLPAWLSKRTERNHISAYIWQCFFDGLSSQRTLCNITDYSPVTQAFLLEHSFRINQEVTDSVEKR